MLNRNARIEELSGIRFYEQDIIYDDHAYSGDIEIVIQGSYLSPGFGIAILNNEGMALQNQKEIYLLKTGMREATAYYKNGLIQKIVKKASTNLYPPINNVYFTFKKRGKLISLSSSLSSQPLIEYAIPDDNWDKYSIGIYSNAGNIIKSMSIAASIPKGWVVNMSNTKGGYIKFAKSSFSILNCKNNAEVEQSGLVVDKGIYYLKYEKSEESDIVPYVFIAGDEEMHIDNKSILKNGYFEIKKKCKINIRFSGKSGTIKNINICENAEDKYVATKDENSKINGSYIRVSLSDLEYVKIVAKINDVPKEDSIKNELDMPYILNNKVEKIDIKTSGVKLGELYAYLFKVKSNSIKIEERSNPENSKEFFLKSMSDYITIFNNLDATILEFKIKKNNSMDIIDLISTDSAKTYVKKDINGPIIAVDNENIPFDLSSSYRFTIADGIKKYRFTNVEREVFNPSERIILNSLPASDINIRIYGIYKNAKIENDNLYYGRDMMFDDLSMYTKDHTRINKTDMVAIDIYRGEIVIDNALDYEKIIVDYEKKESYCINYINELSMYAVEVSSDSSEYGILYDGIENRDGIFEIEKYKQITMPSGAPMMPEDKRYVVIRKD